MKSTSFVLLFAAACGGSTASTTSNTGPTGGGAGGLPAAYAGLFEAKSLTFPAELVTSMDGQTDKQQGTVTCTIADVTATAAGGKMMTLGCTSELEMPSSPSGTFVGTADGLWQIGEGEAETDLPADRKLLGATPAAARVEKKDPTPEMEAGEATIVEAHAGGWCISRSSWGGDEGGWTLCLKDGALVGGGGFFAGGSTRDLYFGETKRQ